MLLWAPCSGEHTAPHSWQAVQRLARRTCCRMDEPVASLDFRQVKKSMIAVRKVIGIVTASAKLIQAGLGASISVGAITWLLKAPGTRQELHPYRILGNSFTNRNHHSRAL